MGFKTWLFILFIARLGYQWFPVKEHNILVLVDSKELDVSKLAQVKNLKAVFRIDQNIDDHMKRDNPKELETKVRFFYL